jgi:hypothetical protein
MKIQKQYDIYRNKNYAFVCHDSYIEKDKKYIRRHSKGRLNENWPSGEYPPDKIIGSSLTIPHTSSLFFLKKFLNFNFFKYIEPADYPLIVLLSLNGQIYFYNEPMSVYRQNYNSLSYTRTHKDKDKKLINKIAKNHYKMIKYLDKKYENEIKNNLKGHYMIRYTSLMKESLENKKYHKSLYYLFRAILISKNSYLTKKDILWLFKESLKTSKVN